MPFAKCLALIEDYNAKMGGASSQRSRLRPAAWWPFHSPILPWLALRTA